MDEIIKELSDTSKWLQDYEKDSKWYREYLDKVCTDLKEASKL